MILYVNTKLKEIYLIYFKIKNTFKKYDLIRFCGRNIVFKAFKFVC